ncbi:MAG: hypothetical protein ACOYXM_08730 [Actinomycetota bacterium]
MTEPLGEPQATSFVDSLGPRGLRRAEPRASIAIAGAGCALAIIGVMIVAGDTGAGDDDFNKVPGIVLSALVVGAGFFTLRAVRQGPLATAGAAAAALGVPPLMFFITFDLDSLPPYSTEGILIVSTGVWLATYAVGPGRGRPFFLGAGLIGLWFSLLQLTEKVFDAPFGVMGMFGGFSAYDSYNSEDFTIEGDGFDSGFETGGTDGFDTGGFEDGGFSTDGFDSGGFDGGEFSFDVPDPTTIGVLSLALGVGYLVVCRWLDRRGHHGAGTPFAFAALPTLYTGIAAMADDLEQAGTGLLLVVVGGALALHGASVGRRITAWVGGAAAASGTAEFLSDMTDDATIAGMLFMAAGLALVAAAHALAAAIEEPDEMAVTAVAVLVGGAGSIPAAPPPPPDESETSQWAPPPEDPSAPPEPPPPA